jgi:hypothetical protein
MKRKLLKEFDMTNKKKILIIPLLAFCLILSINMQKWTPAEMETPQASAATIVAELQKNWNFATMDVFQDKQETMHLVFIDATNYDIFYTSCPKGGSWAEPTLIHEHGFSSNNKIKLVVSSTGVKYLVATNNYNATLNNFVISHTLNGDWCSFYNLTDNWQPGAIEMKIDSQDKVHIAFSATVATIMNIFYVKMVEGVPGSIINITQMPGPNQYVMNQVPMDLGPDDTVHIAWGNITGTGTRLVHYVKSPVGGFTASPTTIEYFSSMIDVINYFEMALKVDSKGMPHFLWANGTVGNTIKEPRDTYYAKKTTEGFTTPQIVIPKEALVSPTIANTQVYLAIDSHDIVTAMALQGGGVSMLATYISSNVGGTFEPAQNISNTIARFSQLLQITLNKSDNRVICFYRDIRSGLTNQNYLITVDTGSSAPTIDIPNNNGEPQSVTAGTHTITCGDGTNNLLAMSLNTTAPVSITIEVNVTHATPLPNAAAFFSLTSNNSAAISWPVIIEVFYNETDLAQKGRSENNLTVWYLNEGINQWEMLNSTVDQALNKITVTLDHFSDYAIAAKAEGSYSIPPTTSNTTSSNTTTSTTTSSTTTSSTTTSSTSTSTTSSSTGTSDTTSSSTPSKTDDSDTTPQADLGSIPGFPITIISIISIGTIGMLLRKRQ